MEFDQNHHNFDIRSNNLPESGGKLKNKSLRLLSKAAIGCDMSETEGERESKVLAQSKTDDKL